MKTYQVRYTATIVRPDDSDTDGYGEPCEPGHGYDIVTGWLDPNSSLWDVSEERPEEPIDRIDLGDQYDRECLEKFGGDIEEMIRDRVGDVIGFIDHETGDGTYYGGTEFQNYETGEVTIIAAHIEVEEYAATEKERMGIS